VELLEISRKINMWVIEEKYYCLFFLKKKTRAKESEIRIPGTI
jgi:hypothetical protein